MNNLFLAAITFLTLIFFAANTNAKTRPISNAPAAISVSKEMLLAKTTNENSLLLEKTTTNPVLIDIDYIVTENGKAYITYISCNNDDSKLQAIQFIENAPISMPYELGKIYTIQLKLSK